MPTPESSLEALAIRVSRLEAQNRRLKKTGMTSFIVAVAIIMMGQEKPTPNIMRAQKFVVVNASGKEQAALEPRALYLYDDHGVKRVDLGIDSGQQAGAGLSFYNDQGNQMVDLSVPALPGSASLAIFDGKGNERADIGVFLGIAGLGVYGETKGKSGAKVETVGDSSSLQVYGRDSSLAELNTSSTEASLYLSDSKGFGAVLGNGSLVPSISNAPHGNKQSAASLALFGKDKKVLWSAP
jgi:hypothetical protein